MYSIRRSAERLLKSWSSKSTFSIQKGLSRWLCYKAVNRRAITELRNLRRGLPDVKSDGSNQRSLTETLFARIRATGPITVASYMKEVLLNPHTGYYSTKDNVFGDEGDFVTAPEIGQIFGELIAVWCINELQKFNYDGQIQLVELGPGKGTLMLDMLRVYERFGFSKERISVHLVELSSHLQRVQGERLCNGQVERSGQSESYIQRGTTGNGVNIFWYPDIVEVPRGFSIVIANEFFDALPAHVFCKELTNDGGPGWKEVLIDINPDASVPSFRFIQSTKRTPYSVVFGKRFHDKAHLLRDRSRVEVSFEMEQIAQNIANRFADSGGFGLIVDYGHDGNKSDTFRSFKSHKLHDPLVNPGDADLTVDVDFGFLKHFFEQDDKAFTMGPVGQGTFLSAMQGSKRLEELLKSSSSQNWKKSLIAGYEELTNPAKMGDRFKVLAVFPAALKQHLLTGNNVIGFHSQETE